MAQKPKYPVIKDSRPPEGTLARKEYDKEQEQIKQAEVKTILQTAPPQKTISVSSSDRAKDILKKYRGLGSEYQSPENLKNLAKEADKAYQENKKISATQPRSKSFIQIGQDIINKNKPSNGISMAPVNLKTSQPKKYSPTPQATISTASTQLKKGTILSKAKVRYINPFVSGFLGNAPNYDVGGSTKIETQQTSAAAGVAFSLIGSGGSKAVTKGKAAYTAAKAAKARLYEKVAEVTPKIYKISLGKAGLSLAEGAAKYEVALYGTKQYTKAKAPEESKKYYKDATVYNVLGETYQKESSKFSGVNIGDSPHATQKFKGGVVTFFKSGLYDIAGPYIGKESFRKTAVEVARSKGVPESDVNLVVNQVMKERTNRKAADIYAILAPETISESFGRAAKREAYQGLKNIGSLWGRDQLKKEATKISLKTAFIGGALEGGSGAVFMSQARERPVNAKDVALSAGMGSVVSPIFDIPITRSSLAAPSQKGIKRAGKFWEYVGYGVDFPAEIAGDVTVTVAEKGRNTIKRRLGKDVQEDIGFLNINNNQVQLISEKEFKARSISPSVSMNTQKSTTNNKQSNTPLFNGFSSAPSTSNDMSRSPTTNKVSLFVNTPTISDTTDRTTNKDKADTKSKEDKPNKSPDKSDNKTKDTTDNKVYMNTQSDTKEMINNNVNNKSDVFNFMNLPTRNFTPQLRTPPPIPLQFPVFGGGVGTRAGKGRKYANELKESQVAFTTLLGVPTANRSKIYKPDVTLTIPKKKSTTKKGKKKNKKGTNRKQGGFNPFGSVVRLRL